MKRLLLSMFSVMLIVAAYFLLWPIDADPQAWQAPPMPLLENAFSKNRTLQSVERSGVSMLHGAEDVLIGTDGWIYTGTINGAIVRTQFDNEAVEVLANTPGRPLGIEFAPDGNLIIADAKQGLLRLDLQAKPPKLDVLLAEINGIKMRFVDDVAISQAGKVYFSDASQRWGYEFASEAVVENNPTGRIIEYDLSSGQHRVLVEGLSFANGVALDANEASIFINETGRYRVHRYWLTGEKAGSSEVFAENLPGFPDNLSFNASSGILWVALFGPRNALLDALSDKPFLRKALMRLPKALQPQPENVSFVLGFNLQGEVVHNLQYHDKNAYAPITSAEQFGDWLYFGSLSARGIARIQLSAVK